MTSPYQQGYPGQPAPPYAPPQAPQYEQPQQGYAPAPGYPPQQQPQYQQPYQQPAPQGYAPPPPPAVPVAPVTLRDFMNQPASGGNSLSFMTVGTRYSGTVVRTVTEADVDVSTEMNDRTKAAQYNDGRKKLIMKVPLLLDAPTPQFPDGTATWVVKGNERGELLRAMEAAGAQMDPEMGFYRIQAGDHIVITYTHDQPSRSGLNPRKVKAVEYVVGNGVPPQLPQAAAIPAAQPIVTPPQPQYGMPQQGYQQPFGGPGPAAMVQGPGGGLVPTGPGGYPQQPYVQLQQATGQPVAPQFDPVQAQQFQQQYQQPTFPTPPLPPAAPPAIPGYGSGAQPTAPASPSSPGGPPPDWPADVPFIPGLTPDMARVAAAMHHPAAGQQQ